LRWLQDRSEINWRRKVNTHFRNKKREYLRDKINEVAKNSRNKNIRDIYRRIEEVKKSDLPRNNLMKDGNCVLLAGTDIF
jgi:hypothetical protein